MGSGGQGRLLCWVVVAFGCGVGGYFALWDEPGRTGWIGMGMGCAAAIAGTLIRPDWRPVLLPPGAVLAGVLVAGAHAHLGAAPVLTFRYYGPVEGRVVAIDVSQSGKTRVTMDRVRLRDMRVGTVPDRVRISLHGDGVPVPGARMGVTAHLSPPMGPVEPGGFDFSRHAWFARMGAVGYARAPMVVLRPAEGADGAVLSLRRAVTVGVAERIGGAAGGIAAAILTGDRSFIPEEATRDLRRSNLSHLLAISGLHMGLLTGFVFAAVRLGLALTPLGGRLSVRAIAAATALCVATAYLGMSGGNVATQRAYVMVAVAMGAVLIGRRAVTLRAVALAAAVVLVLRPSAITGPGFQMSFAATIALVAAFEAMRRGPGTPTRQPRWARAPLGLVLSSLVAGLATAPFAAAHFNIIAHYGLAANLMAVPAMGLVVMPSAVLAALLWPVGLEGVGLWGMARGLEWIIAVAGTVADLPEATRMVPTPPPMVVPIFALGGVGVVLLVGWVRLAPAAACVLALGLWMRADRPALLIEETGALVGVVEDDTRGLSREAGAGFTARVWLENDGDPSGQKVAATRFGAPVVGGLRIIHLKGKRQASTAQDLCDPGNWLISDQPLTVTGGCRITDPEVLARTGAIAVHAGLVQTARDGTGGRPWGEARYRKADAASGAWRIAPIYTAIR